MTKSIMIQGTGSNVGKSVLVAGLARALTLRGLRVAPFKPQNMSNNAAVTDDGGEIGRAQALQAMAARQALITDMNPVLLKPETDIGAQVVVQGQRLTTVKARDYAKLKPTLMPRVLDSFHRLAAQVDVVLVEGAGSPAEINLRDGDIANMGFAQAANVPVILAGDIDRGGVIAQIVGTHAVVSPSDRDQISGFLVNKFRGDPRLFDDGLDAIVERTNWPSLGVVPWFRDAQLLPAEDAADIRSQRDGRVRVVVPQLSRIANFDDLDPLSAEPDVSVEVVGPGRPLPDADLILIPGSKSTIGDLAFLRAQGWDLDISHHIRRGGHVWGICGGYQMLGKTISDPDGIEGPAGTVDGLGHLDVHTVMVPKKTLDRTQATLKDANLPVSGYEIHIGETDGPDCKRGWLTSSGRPHGAQDASGRVRGAYLHGLFESDPFRAHVLAQFGIDSQMEYSIQVDQVLDNLAAHLETHMDIDALLGMMRPVGAP